MKRTVKLFDDSINFKDWMIDAGHDEYSRKINELSQLVSKYYGAFTKCKTLQDLHTLHEELLSTKSKIHAYMNRVITPEYPRITDPFTEILADGSKLIHNEGLSERVNEKCQAAIDQIDILIKQIKVKKKKYLPEGEYPNQQNETKITNQSSTEEFVPEKGRAAKWIDDSKMSLFISFERQLHWRKYINQDMQWQKEKNDFAKYFCILLHNEFFKVIVEGRRMKEADYRHFIEERYNTSLKHQWKGKLKPNIETASNLFHFLRDTSY